MAFGVASGLGAEAGIYSAIAVGFFAAVFGGTPSQISGPTGPMTVAMAVVVAQYASTPVEAFTVVMLGGLFQIALGVLRIGRFVSYTPYSVISGFMTGIGVIIIIIQVLPFLGIAAVPGGPVDVIFAWPGLLGSFNTDAVIIAVVALVIGFAWRGLPARYVPAPLVALVVGSLLGVFLVDFGPNHRGNTYRIANPAGAAAGAGFHNTGYSARHNYRPAGLHRQPADVPHRRCNNPKPGISPTRNWWARDWGT